MPPVTGRARSRRTCTGSPRCSPHSSGRRHGPSACRGCPPSEGNRLPSRRTSAAPAPVRCGHHESARVGGAFEQGEASRGGLARASRKQPLQPGAMPYRAVYHITCEHGVIRARGRMADVEAVARHGIQAEVAVDPVALSHSTTRPRTGAMPSAQMSSLPCPRRRSRSSQRAGRRRETPTGRPQLPPRQAGRGGLWPPRAPQRLVALPDARTDAPRIAETRDGTCNLARGRASVMT